MTKKKSPIEYSPPLLYVLHLLLEGDISAGSALAKPQTPENVSTEWDTSNDINQTLDWDWQ